MLIKDSIICEKEKSNCGESGRKPFMPDAVDSRRNGFDI
jgi:hypothetical protein